jgi:hypothetical protein
MSKVKVTFHRTYEEDVEVVKERLLIDNFDSEITDEVIECEAENIARDYLEEDMELIDSTSDNFSTTVEIIK